MIMSANLNFHAQGKGLFSDNPSKCLLCCNPIGRSDKWVTLSNGKYRVIYHLACFNVRVNQKGQKRSVDTSKNRL